MKKIKNITTKTLRNDEFYGLFSEGLNLAKSITDIEAQQAIAAYETSIKELAKFLETDLSESAEHMASLLNTKRNSVYISCRRVAQGFLNFPDKEQTETCAKIWKIFSESPNPTRLNQAQSTGVILNIVQGIRKIGDESLNAVGFKIWIESLAQLNDEFMEMDMARFAERGNREQDHGKKLRIACYEAFTVVAAAATLKAASGSESCITFIDSMNAAIAAKKLQVKIRQSRPKTNDNCDADSTMPMNAEVVKTIESAA